jgi:hypothetical protein
MNHVTRYKKELKLHRFLLCSNKRAKRLLSFGTVSLRATYALNAARVNGVVAFTNSSNGEWKRGGEGRGGRPVCQRRSCLNAKDVSTCLTANDHRLRHQLPAADS